MDELTVSAGRWHIQTMLYSKNRKSKASFWAYVTCAIGERVEKKLVLFRRQNKRVQGKIAFAPKRFSVFTSLLTAKKISIVVHDIPEEFDQTLLVSRFG